MEDREEIYRLRHEVYAREIGQHRPNLHESLSDALDEWNTYLVACVDGEIGGFVSITPPASPAYSIEKYFTRDELPFAVHEKLYEVRLLTVLRPYRGTEMAALLMYAALRWIEARGGTHLMAIGRREVLSVYLKAGFTDVGGRARSGEVQYHLLHQSVAHLRLTTNNQPELLHRLERHCRWRLGVPYWKPAACFHGGAFFESLGERFDRLEARDDIINADVLDAWFPPAPAVTEALQEHLPWLLRTSPPASCAGLTEVIAANRGVKPEQILVGAGSSDLIFRALPRWLDRRSRVLLLDPTYGEYAHILEQVIGCRVDRLSLPRERGYEVPLAALEEALRQPYDLVVLVNPNSPTGRHVSKQVLLSVLRTAAARTRIWIDETYVDFVHPSESLEAEAAMSENFVVCKSMSKAYALSGARVAYLCAGPHQLEELRALTPPWVVGLVSQVAAVRALEAPAYYRARWAETAELRGHLAAALRYRGLHVIPGSANFLLTHLPEHSLTAEDLVWRCRMHGLFLRDAARMGAGLGDRAVRFAVKDAVTQRHMLTVLDEVLGNTTPRCASHRGRA
jgi:histidinol-phosphate/aromatic aminotransferase/cobyric acid decarboxylase-like protein/GNAT superfamily N-acetyltransferase